MRLQLLWEVRGKFGSLGTGIGPANSVMTTDANLEQVAVFRPYLNPQKPNWAHSSGVLKMTSKAAIYFQTQIQTDAFS